MTFVIKEEVVVPVGKAAQAQAGRDRARDARLKAARERRLNLDPDRLVRERRIDEAAVDIEVAWEERARAEQSILDAEVAAAAAIEQLLSERLAMKDVVHLTGLDPATVRRLRQFGTGGDETDDASRAVGAGSEGADAEVA